MKTNEIEKIIERKKRLSTQKLLTRQHALKTFLEEHQIGRYWSIEEICELVRDSEGKPYCILNIDPHNHDKQILLSNDVRELNWHTGRERYIPIIKDSKGGIKLAESREELEAYISKEKKRYENAFKYYNHLSSLIELEGTIPFINQANRVLKDSEIKPVEVYAK